MFGTRSVPSENCKQILATPNRLVQTVVIRVRSTLVVTDRTVVLESKLFNLLMLRSGVVINVENQPLVHGTSDPQMIR